MGCIEKESIMALPNINDNPLYSVSVPSTGKEVKFRPFLVKEQKILMIVQFIM